MDPEEKLLKEIQGEDHAQYPAWRWFVLLAFAMNCGGNSFMFMDFTTVPDLTKQVFGYCPFEGDCIQTNSDSGDSFVGWTYSASLLAVLPAAFPVFMYLDKKNWITSGVGMFCNFLGGWLRYASVEQARNGNYAHARTVALTSSIFIGFAAAVIICSYSAISSRWFPESERTLATTFAVQSNYAGWCVGCILFPYVVVSEDALVTVQLYQAIFLTLCFAAFLAFHREYPKGHEPFE